ncbi:MAG TPA: CHAT domain-containing protein [Pyrinomonadaceae bacterium]|nr:CHAT domain-containing protein [Pyrinomonadaceae bacterium]
MKKAYLGLAGLTLVIPAIISAWKAWRERLDPPKYCSWLDVLAPPPDYRFLFYIVIVVAAVLILILLKINKDRLKNFDRSQVTKRIIALGLLSFASLLVYAALSRQCVICHDTNGIVYFPLWLKGEAANVVREMGGRYETLDALGETSTPKLIREMPGFSLAINVTTALFLLAYAGIFLPLTTLLGLLTFYEEKSALPGTVEKMIRILFLAANPGDTETLRIDEEVREIDDKIRKAQFRDRFDLEQQWAVRVDDLQDHLLRYQPDIVHFSGHGSEANEIILQDESGNSHPVSARALGNLFSTLKGNTRCVVLNACYSEPQAQAIAKHIDCVVGMSSAITDDAARSFAAAFYRALAYGRDVQTAYDSARVQIELENLKEEDTPRLIIRESCKAEDIKFV